MNRKNFTEILHIAGQRHNHNQFDSPDDKADNEATKAILTELGIDADEILKNIDEIETEIYDDVRDDDTRWTVVSRACTDLRRIITEAIGE